MKNMRRGRKQKLLTTALLMSLMLCLSTLFSISAIAAETNEVTKIKIEVTNDDGIVKFSSAEEKKYTVTSPIGELSAAIGDTDKHFEVTVTTKENHSFEGISKGDISFRNDTSGVKCTDVSYDQQTAIIDIKIDTIRGKLESPDSAWWDDDDFGVAHWEEVDGATGYQVTINNSKITINNSTEKDLRSYLEWGKNNSFKVRAISSKKGVSDSSYTKSDTLDLTEDSYWWDEYYYNNCDYGVRPGGRPNRPHYDFHNHGVYYRWIQYDNKWYFLDQYGQIKTGWIEYQNDDYYLNDSGEMLTGWNQIGGSWYYFSSDGQMLKNTSIKSANGMFDYYLDHEGKMITNRWQKNHIGWYYIGNDEPLKNCESNIDGATYRFDSNCYMVTGWWQDTNGDFYYYYPDGTKAFNTIVWWNNNMYRLDWNGKWIH